ncbi:DUF6339 family protein [Peribacillus frigoritolerans]|uniref:DUF6339 family protein n=1 Tax=Peribacillus frigoritolerans TaxID=450367 RepID=UPI0039A26774
MMKPLRVFKQKSLNDLYNFLKVAELKTLESLIIGEEKWVENWFKDQFKDEEWFFESNLYHKKIILKPDPVHDFDNAVALHSSLSLTRIQATDERLWGYLSLVYYWDYTSKRWSVGFDSASESSQRTTILSRYVLKLDSKSDRPFLRNALSRLWWVAEMTVDETRKDKYELTKIILSNTDIYQQVMERSFSRNEEVIRGILELFSELGEEVYLNKRFYRIILKEVNAIGGVVLLDFLTKDDLKKYVRQNLSI